MQEKKKVWGVGTGQICGRASIYYGHSSVVPAHAGMSVALTNPAAKRLCVPFNPYVPTYLSTDSPYPLLTTCSPHRALWDTA